MAKGNIIGRLLAFWMFILAGLIVGRLSGIVGNGMSAVIMALALAGVFIVWNVFRDLGKKKRMEREAANVAPIHKGGTHTSGNYQFANQKHKKKRH